MRTLVRAGAVALAAGTLVLGAGAAAQAAPAGKVTVSVNRLILEPGQYGHTGNIQIAVTNGTSEPFSGGVTITEPIAGTMVHFDGAGGCTLDKTPDNRDISNCYTDSPIAAGATGIITIGFDSPAKPQPFAQVAPALGRVEVAGRTATFPAIFRSTTGKLTHPRVYVQDTESKLTVTASDVTLTRQADGTFAGRSTVTVRNDGDAPHHNLQADLATPPGVEDWPFIDPADVCVGPSEGFPVPAGYFGEGCFVLGQVAEGQTRTFDWILRAPEETPAGSLGNAITRVQFSTGWPAQANAANTPSFTVTVAG
jgi:hypothetical protein